MNGGVDAAHAAVLMGAGSDIIAQVVTAAAPVAAAADAAGGDRISDGSALILLSALCFGVHVFRTDVIFGESGLGAAMTTRQAMGRGLHASTFQLNLSAFRGIGDAFRDYWEGD